jgi:hypothetical protein
VDLYPAPQYAFMFCYLTKNRYFLGCFAELRKATFTFVMSVSASVRLSAWNNSVPTGPIFMKFGIGLFFENASRRLMFRLNQTRITGNLYEDQYVFLIISHFLE